MKSQLFPGAIVYHQLLSPICGRIYVGHGLKNRNLPFITPAPADLKFPIITPAPKLTLKDYFEDVLRCDGDAPEKVNIEELFLKKRPDEVNSDEGDDDFDY